MYALFELLFRRTFWSILLRKDTWREAKVHLRRAHKDRRARKQLFALGLMLVAPVACLAYLAWLAGTGALFLAPFVIPVLWWHRRRLKQDAIPLRIAPGPEPIDRIVPPEEVSELRKFFAERALFYAVMADRAGSEIFQKEKVLPDGFEVTSRRTHLELLRTHGLWDRMAQSDREAMLMADGHWEWKLINEVGLALEPLRLTRWILRLELYLPLIGEQMRGSFGLAHELVIKPEGVLRGSQVTEVASLRIGRDAANLFLTRCVAEGMHRGFYEVLDGDTATWAREQSEGLRGRQHDDLVLNGRLVGEATDDEVRWATSLSSRRAHYLQWAMDVMEKGSLYGDLMTVMNQDDNQPP
jgi:hypothetical protein